MSKTLPNPIPNVIVALAKLHADVLPVELRLAQFLLEVGWTDGEGSSLMLAYNNLAGIKRSREEVNRKYQDGEVKLGGCLYATYRDYAQCFKDWDAKLLMHRSWSPGLTYLQLFDKHWSPLEDQKDGVAYSVKIVDLVNEYNLKAYSKGDLPVATTTTTPTVALDSPFHFLEVLWTKIKEVEKALSSGPDKKKAVLTFALGLLNPWLSTRGRIIQKAVEWGLGLLIDEIVDAWNAFELKAKTPPTV